VLKTTLIWTATETLLGLLFGPEDGGDTFLGDGEELLLDYEELNPKR
jgi:hypothetical protein